MIKEREELETGLCVIRNRMAIEGRLRKELNETRMKGKGFRSYVCTRALSCVCTMYVHYNVLIWGKLGVKKDKDTIS